MMSGASGAGDGGKSLAHPEHALEQGGEGSNRAVEGCGQELADFKDVGIIDCLAECLRSRGVRGLWRIQSQTFKHILDGKDLIALARTGQGKTLAYVLPVIHNLYGGDKVAKRGRTPRALVLVPTRELAKQVFGEFDCYASAAGLQCVCLYGGEALPPQESALRAGTDVVVGTPGRIKDHIDRGTLNLSGLDVRILDEADEMLGEGFEVDVKEILASGRACQTLMLSATMSTNMEMGATALMRPSWRLFDVVEEDEIRRVASTVRHVAIPFSRSQMVQAVIDVLGEYGGKESGQENQAIVFTETKADASLLARALRIRPSARALHGDLSQSQREVTMMAFRKGNFNTLVATDVAARGLDISSIRLVVQCEPPLDLDTYVHRAGRTGRAGRKGVSVTLFTPPRGDSLLAIEKRAKLKIERVNTASPARVGASRSFLSAALSEGAF